MLIELNFKDFVGEIGYEKVRGRRGVLGPTWNDLLVLLRLLGIYQPRRCLEIGIHEGHTAKLLLEVSKIEKKLRKSHQTLSRLLIIHLCSRIHVVTGI